MLAEGNGHTLTAVRLLVHQHVSDKDTHLARVDLVDQGVEGQIDRLHRVDSVRKHALSIRREVHARIVHGRSDQGECRARASAIPLSTHALGLHHVAVLIKDHGDDPIRQLLPAEFLAERSDITIKPTAHMHLQLVIRMPSVHHTRHEGTLGAPVLVPRQGHDHPGIIMPNPHLAGVTIDP